MKNCLAVVALFLGLPLLAESYTYGTGSMNMILPGAGVGYRSYPSKHGYDISTRIEGINGGWWGYRAKGLYLFRPQTKGFYTGLGGGVQYTMYEQQKTLCPTVDVVCGYEWEKTFLQVEASSWVNKTIVPCPAVTYGFHF